MDEDGLPLVGPGVDYTKVESISQKRTIAFLNHFITHTASFLNRFSNVCEEKLEGISNRIQQLEINMNILEAKLSSIPGLENVTAPTSSQSTTTGTSSTAAAPAATTSADAPAAPLAPPAPGAPAAPNEAPPPPPEEPKQDNPVSKDPRYAKYFKLINVGVPPQAIKNKMIMEGLDPNFLDTPEAPAPPMDHKKNDDSDENFSDSSKSDSDSDFD